MTANKSYLILFRTTFAFLLLFVLLGAYAAPAGQVSAETAPTIDITCRVVPEEVEAGQTATLFVDVANVPVETETGYGMRSYDITMSFGTAGKITFTESAPRVGPAPWDNSFDPGGVNAIDNITGLLRSARLKTNPGEAFSGAATLFSAPFVTNTAGTQVFTFSVVDVPYHLDEDYNITAHNCQLTVLEPKLRLYLPIVSR